MKRSWVFWILGVVMGLVGFAAAVWAYFENGPMAASPILGLALSAVFICLGLSRYFKPK